jgi:hypothetical protein
MLTTEAGRLHVRGVLPSELESQLQEINETHCVPPLPSDEVSKIAASISRYPQPENVAAMLNDERPRVLLSSDNRLVSEVAAELAPHLVGELYNYNGTIVAVESAKVRTIGAQEFRTLVERRLICCRIRSTGRGGIAQVGITMSVEEARALLASPQLREGLLPLRSVVSCRMPVMRSGGTIELLPAGYDLETATLTIESVEYRDDLPFNEAVKIINGLFGDFDFVAPRDLSVAVSALVGLYARAVLPLHTLRPVFLYTKNAEGAGATTCAACAIVTVTGSLPTGTAPSENDEMRKMLTASVLEGRIVVFLDNCKRTIGGEALESFTSAPTWRDRLLGVNENVEYENNATVFVTGNGATCTPDMRRRALQCELHLSEERAEDKVFKRPLNVNVLRVMRSQHLAACWSLVRHWDELKRPGPSRSHSAFSEWAEIIGGIVEAAGFGCALSTPESSIVVDEDGEAMRELVDAMSAQPGTRYAARDIFTMCRAREVFLQFVGGLNSIMSNAELSKMGKILGRYNSRMVGNWRFVIEGKGHQKRFFVEAVAPLDKHGDTVEHGVPPKKQKMTFSTLRGKTVLDRATVLPPPPPRGLAKFATSTRASWYSTTTAKTAKRR